MSRQARQVEPHHLLLYDGECGFCHAAVQFVLSHDRRRTFHFAALQSEPAAAALAPFGGRPVDLTTFYVIVDYAGDRPKLLARSSAAIFVARAMGLPWSLAAAGLVLPRPWRDAAYAVVARHRHHILGRADACIVPRPQDRDRFLDAGGAP